MVSLRHELRLLTMAQLQHEGLQLTVQSEAICDSTITTCRQRGRWTAAAAAESTCQRQSVRVI